MLESNKSGYITLPTINQGAVVNEQFTITNNCKNDIDILSITAGCGCTVPSGIVGKMLQGASQTINFSYNSRGKHGQNINSVIIKWRDADNLIKTLSQSFKVTVL